MKKAARNPREPSRASLKEMPEVNLKDGRWRPNPYAARIAREGMVLPGRGRPRKGQEVGPTIPRSVRFPAAIWRELEAKAEEQGVSLHAALRLAILKWVRG